MPSVSGSRQVLSDTATEWAFSVGWQVVRRMPESAARKVFDLAADNAWRKQGAGVRQLERNLARVRPELDARALRELSRAGMRSYMRYWCEAFRLPSMSNERVRDGFELHDVGVLDDAMASGTGALMVVNHGGNWDLAGTWAAQRYGRVTTVAERLKPEGLFQQFVAFREARGMEILPLGDARSFRALAERLNAGGLVALVGDRDISRNGVVVDLLGEPASLPAGPALLSHLTGAPLYPVTMSFDGDIARGDIGARIEVPDIDDRTERVAHMTQDLANAFGVGLREHAVDWHMLQPVWLADLPPRAKAKES